MSDGDGHWSTPNRFVDARELRRQLGPMASSVLADILDDARPDGGGYLVALTNVRRLAANLGVSKDTAARSLRRLAALGLVEAIPALRAKRGRIGRACYLSHRRDGGVVWEGVQASSAPSKPSGRDEPHSTAKRPASQPSLFDGA